MSDFLEIFLKSRYEIWTDGARGYSYFLAQFSGVRNLLYKTMHKICFIVWPKKVK